MYSGLYTAVLGMKAREKTLEVQANNIANSSTDGFKAERLSYSTFETDERGSPDSQPTVAGVLASSSTDYSTGQLRETGATLDVSIRGDGFFKIQTERGPRFTRAGSFSQDAAGQLVTKNGDLVLGDQGPITLPKDATVAITRDGVITAKGKPIGKISVARFDNPVTALKKDGDSLFALTGEGEAADVPNPDILQGTLESSNVNPVNEMVEMINNTREFESLQRSVTLMMNDVGKKISTELGRA
ncbi:MAG: flagellar basal-body rod protein FlgF [Pyrinomonadaceae bacterium]